MKIDNLLKKISLEITNRLFTSQFRQKTLGFFVCCFFFCFFCFFLCSFFHCFPPTHTEIHTKYMYLNCQRFIISFFILCCIVLYIFMKFVNMLV